jgi:hypothetical protein
MSAATIMAGTTAVASTADYTSNGTPNTLIFKTIFGDPRADGPNLLISGAPALPAGAAVTVKLDGMVVRAKDGKTAFIDNDNFGGGKLTFSTVGFTASVTPPPAAPLPADAGACATPGTDVALDAPATITFSSPVDPAALTTAMTVTASAGAAHPSVPVMLTSTDGLNVTVAPMDTWPANATVTITVAATATDLAGDTLGAPATGSFHTVAQ